MQNLFEVPRCIQDRVVFFRRDANNGIPPDSTRRRRPMAQLASAITFPLFHWSEMTPTSEHDDKRQRPAGQDTPFRRRKVRQGVSRATAIDDMSKGQSEAISIPIAPHAPPWILVGTAGAAAAAGVLGLLTVMGNIVEDKVQKATAPLGVQLVEMDKRIKGVEEAALQTTQHLRAIDSRLTRVEAKLDTIDLKLTK